MEEKMKNKNFDDNKLIYKEELTLEERYYLEGFDYGFDNISIKNLKEFKNNSYFLKGFQDGLKHYQNTLKTLYIK